MYSYRTIYVQKEVDNLLKDNVKICSASEENITNMHYFGNAATEHAFRELNIAKETNAVIPHILM